MAMHGIVWDEVTISDRVRVPAWPEMCDNRTMPTHSSRRARLTSWLEVGGRVLDARRAAGLTQQQLAGRLGLDRSAVTRVERGERQLDALELVRLADALDRPVEWFVSAPPPVLASRREGRADAVDADVLDGALELVAGEIQLLLDVGELRGADTPSLDPPTDMAEAEVVAVEARTLLDAVDGPLLDLQARCEHVRLYAYALDLGPPPVDAAYVRLGENAGVCVVNGAVDAGRRRFNLAHELGHHLFADEYAADFAVGQAPSDRERLINAFAVHLLMPRADLTDRWHSLRALDDRQRLVCLAAEYRVSWTAAVGHAATLGLIDQVARGVLSAHRPTRVDYLELDVMVHEELQAPAIPPGAARAALRAYRRHLLGGARVVELLHGTVTSDDLPEPAALPIDALRDDFRSPVST